MYDPTTIHRTDKQNIRRMFDYRGEEEQGLA